MTKTYLSSQVIIVLNIGKLEFRICFGFRALDLGFIICHFRLEIRNSNSIFTSTEVYSRSNPLDDSRRRKVRHLPSKPVVHSRELFWQWPLLLR
jgi:hypothetical protein